MKFKHLTIEEREKIQEMLWQKASIREIAKKLKRSPSSIAREVKKNLPKEFRRYTPRVALRPFLRRRRRIRISDDEIRFVERELNSRPRKRLGWKTPLEAWSVAIQG